MTSVEAGNGTHTVQLQRVPDCPRADRVRELMRSAAAACGMVVELDELIGEYPSPTVLVDGRDVTGVSPAEGASCRLDLPTEDQIRAALQRRLLGAHGS